jgi:Flp pilus assembly pilin Flp
MHSQSSEKSPGMYSAHFSGPPLQRYQLKRQGLGKDQSGQGLIEYLIIVALMGVATIAIVRVMSQTVASRFASVTYALQGTKKSAQFEKVDEGSFKKRDLGNFFDGVGDKGDRGGKQ